MIKLETKHGNFEELVVAGNVVEITADLLTIIRQIYSHLDDEEVKETYKEIMIGNIETAFWDGEKLFEEADKAEERKKTKEKNLKKLDKILDHLNEVLDSMTDEEDETVDNEG